MNSIVKLTALAAIMIADASSVEALNVTVNLTDRLEQPIYARAWAVMLRGQPALPHWLADKAGGAPEQPEQKAEVEGHEVQIYFACQLHDCGDNHFVVMFLNQGKEAKAVLTVAGKPPRFFGRPDSAEAAALLRAAK